MLLRVLCTRVTFRNSVPKFASSVRLANAEVVPGTGPIMENRTAAVIDQISDTDYRTVDCICTMCGKPIDTKDCEHNVRTRRCQQCQYELDTDSGPIRVL